MDTSTQNIPYIPTNKLINSCIYSFPDTLTYQNLHLFISSNIYSPPLIHLLTSNTNSLPHIFTRLIHLLIDSHIFSPHTPTHRFIHLFITSYISSSPTLTHHLIHLLLTSYTSTPHTPTHHLILSADLYS